MLFRLVIWLIGLKIDALHKRDRKFQYAVREKRVVIQFALQNGKPVRYLEFDRGKFASVSGWHDRVGAAASHGHLGERVAIFSFASAMTGLMLLIKGSSDSTIMLNAIRDKELIITGDFTVFMWFGWLADQL